MCNDICKCWMGLCPAPHGVCFMCNMCGIPSSVVILKHAVQHSITSDPDVPVWQCMLQLRSLIVNMVLSTDMAVHFQLLGNFSSALDKEGDVSKWQDRSLIFQMLVHLADLANPSRPFPFALKWAENVVTEFMEQVRLAAFSMLTVVCPPDACHTQLAVLVMQQQAQLSTLVVRQTAHNDNATTLW